MSNAQFITLGPFFYSGMEMTSAKLYHYAAGSTTLKNIWSDRSESTTLAQPFVSDANGVWAFFADGLYKFVITTSDDVPVFTWDNFLIQDFLNPSFSEGSPITSSSTIAVGPETWTHITGSTNIDTITGTIPFFWAVFDGSLSLNYSASLLTPGGVNLTVQPNDVVFFLNDGSGVWRVAGQMPNSLLINRTDVTITVSDTRTNSVDAPLTITSQTSGTPAAGIGTGILFRAESQDEAPSDFGQISFIANDVGTGTEDTFFQVLARVGGAALTQVWAFVATGAFTGTFLHANSADRAYTLPNANCTLVGKDTTDTLTNKTFDAQGTGNNLTNVSTSALKTATGSASGGPPLTATLNDYAFSPSITNSSGNSIVAAQAIADPSTTVARFTVDPTSAIGGTNIVRWRYVTASDDPTIWVAIDNVTGIIRATWTSDDPIPGNLPGVTLPDCTSVLLKAHDLESIALLQAHASDAADLIASRRQSMKHQAYRALQLLTGDDAPSQWLLKNCQLTRGKLEVKPNGH